MKNKNKTEIIGMLMIAVVALSSVGYASTIEENIEKELELDEYLGEISVSVPQPVAIEVQASKPQPIISESDFEKPTNLTTIMSGSVIMEEVVCITPELDDSEPEDPMDCIALFDEDFPVPSSFSNPDTVSDICMVAAVIPNADVETHKFYLYIDGKLHSTGVNKPTSVVSEWFSMSYSSALFEDWDTTLDGNGLHELKVIRDDGEVFYTMMVEVKN
jgi:hypothetical protein